MPPKLYRSTARRVFLVGGLMLQGPLTCGAYLRYPGDPPNPSILTHPPGNARIFLIIFYILTFIAVLMLLALVTWAWRKMRDKTTATAKR